MENENIQNTHTKTWLTALLVVLILVGGYLWFKGAKEDGADPIIRYSEPRADVIVEKPATSGGIPLGFPADIPLERASVFESYKATYTERGVVQYTVSYTTSVSKERKWDEYYSFLTGNGYTISETATSKATGNLYGTKDNTGLVVTITPQGDKRTVRLNFFER